MRRLLILLALCAALPTTVPAQSGTDGAPEDAMELQRCIWRCQADTTGDSAYAQCVERLCNDQADEPPYDPGEDTVDPLSGRLEMTRTNMVTSASVCETEILCLVVSCHRRKQLFFELFIVEPGMPAGAPIDLYLKGTKMQFVLPGETNGMHRFPMHPRVLQALQQGGPIAINTSPPDRRTLAEFPMTGSRETVSEVVRACK